MFFNFKGKIVFGDPPCLKLRPPLERESLPPKTPQMRGPQDRPGPLKMRFFSTEIDGSGWPLVSGFLATEPLPVSEFQVFGVLRGFSEFFSVF